MILSKIIAATMICAFSLAFSQSQDWVSVGKSSSNFEFLVKDFSKTNRPDIYSGWVKTVYAPKNIKNKKGVIISQRSNILYLIGKLIATKRNITYRILLITILMVKLLAAIIF